MVWRNLLKNYFFKQLEFISIFIKIIRNACFEYVQYICNDLFTSILIIFI
jgi:hypothetical protein